MSKSRGQVLWAFGFAGLGASCGAREATPSLSVEGVHPYHFGNAAASRNGRQRISPVDAPSVIDGTAGVQPRVRGRSPTQLTSHSAVCILEETETTRSEFAA